MRLARWCTHRVYPYPVICRDSDHAFRRVKNPIGSASGCSWPIFSPQHLRSVWRPCLSGTGPAPLAWVGLGTVARRRSVMCGQSFCRGVGAACTGYTKTTWFFLTVELGGGQPALIREQIVSKTVATGLARRGTMGCSLSLGIVRMWFGLDHMKACSLVGVCVQVYVGRTTLMLRRRPPPC